MGAAPGSPAGGALAAWPDPAARLRPEAGRGRYGGGMGAGRARGLGRGRGGGGLPRQRSGPAAAFISPRGRWPWQRCAPATSRPQAQRTDPTSLVPGQTLIHELCEGKNWTLSSAPPDPRGLGRSPVPPISSTRSGMAARLDINGRARDLRAPHLPWQPVQDLQPLVPLCYSRASKAPAGALGRLDGCGPPGARKLREPPMHSWALLPPGPLPATPTLAPGTSPRCPETEQPLQCSVGRRS